MHTVPGICVSLITCGKKSYLESERQHIITSAPATHVRLFVSRDHAKSESSFNFAAGIEQYPICHCKSSEMARSRLLTTILSLLLRITIGAPTENNFSVGKGTRPSPVVAGCTGPMALEIDWVDCASIVHDHFNPDDPDSSNPISWSYQPGSDHLLPLDYTHQRCGITIRSNDPTGQHVGRWSKRAVRDALLLVFVECSDLQTKGYGGIKGLGETDQYFYVEAYAPQDFNIGLFGGSNVTDVATT